MVITSHTPLCCAVIKEKPGQKTQHQLPFPLRRGKSGGCVAFKMASPVPICSVGPPRASQTLTKGRHRLEFALGRLTSTVTSCNTAQKALGSFNSNQGVLSVNQSCHQHLVARPSFISETQSLYLIADYCNDIVISGYWVGPGVDDGWGFVEAIINQVT